jgi:opacity protein-like surface antigen
MARRASLIAKKVKKPRTTRSESYFINRKYMGDEPEFLGAMTEGEMAMAYNWYNAMADKSEIKEYTETWLKNQNRLAELKKFKSVPDEWVNNTCGAIARMISKGYDVPVHSKKFLEETFAYTLTKAKVQAESTIPKASVQDRMRDRQNDIIGDIEELIDACQYYVSKTNRRITFEWALIRGETDTVDTAHELGNLLQGLLCHVNVIPLNPTKGSWGLGLGAQFNPAPNYFIAAGVKYFWTPASQFSLSIGGELSYDTAKDDATEVKTNTIGLNVPVGLHYFVSDSFAITSTWGGLNYSSAKADFDGAKAATNL